jgi:hydrogenase maturation protease
MASVFGCLNAYVSKGIGPLKLFEAGTAGLAALDYFEGCRKVLVVDALKSGGAPGLVRCFTMDELGSPDDEYSLHQLGVNHLGAVTAAFAGRVAPKVVVIGAEIGVRSFHEPAQPGAGSRARNGS